MVDYNINAVTRRVVFSGSAGVGPYAFTFEVLEQTDIAVYKNSVLLTLTTDYTVTINANGTGSITLVVAATGADTVTIIGSRAIERTTDFVTAGDLLASSLNEQLDSQIVMIQQLAEENKRTMKAPSYDPADVADGGTANLTLPAAADRANLVMAFDASGNPIATEEIGDWKGNWATATTYAKRDIVKDASNNNVYRANTAHTSSGSAPISGNADTAKWDLVVDAATAAASASAAATSESNAASSASTASSAASAAASSATDALASETAAGVSETNAAASEVAAGISETNAAASEVAAGISETNAAASEATITSGLYQLKPSEGAFANGDKTKLDSTTQPVASVAALEALTGAAEKTVLLLASGREGIFVWDGSNLSTEVAADTAQGIYIAPTSDATGASGSWVRQYNGSVNVKWFGATGDGVTDDTTGFQSALTAAVAASKTLYTPTGTYLLSAQLTTSSANPARIEGAGAALATLVWTDTATSGGGISITFTDYLAPPFVSGLTLLTQAAGATGDTALKIIGPETASVTQYGATVHDIDVRGYSTVTDYWDIGIEFNKCWYVNGTEITIKGLDDASSPFDQTVGIKITGCMVTHLSKFSIFHVETAVLEAASGGPTHGEGFSFSDFEIVGVTDGIDMTADLNGVGSNIGPGHINAYANCIKFSLQTQMIVHDCLLYKTHVSSSSWKAIDIVSSSTTIIHDNHIHGQAAANVPMTLDPPVFSACYGIAVVNADSVNNSIHNNIFAGMDTGSTRIGILLGTGCGNTRIHDNTDIDGTTTAILQIDAAAEKNNICRDNFPTAIQTFAANDATPSVGNAFNQHFNTANSVATTVTALDDGYVGQVVSIMCNDANTTFQHNGTGFVLQGSANFAAGAGAIITFRQDAAGGLWREMSRRTA